jgi:hypothetical protein
MKIFSTYLPKAHLSFPQFNKSSNTTNMTKMGVGFATGVVLGLLAPNFLSRYGIVPNAHQSSIIPQNETTRKVENLIIGAIVSQPIHFFLTSQLQQMGAILKRYGFTEVPIQAPIEAILRTNQISHPYVRLISKVMMFAIICFLIPIGEEKGYRGTLFDILKNPQDGHDISIDYRDVAFTTLVGTLPYLSRDVKKTTQTIVSIIVTKVVITRIQNFIISSMNKKNSSNPNMDSLPSRVQRICANAFIFGLDHFHPLQGISNAHILINTSIMGVFFATLREITGSILPSTVAHIWCNTQVCLLLHQYMEAKKN